MVATPIVTTPGQVESIPTDIPSMMTVADPVSDCDATCRVGG